MQEKYRKADKRMRSLIYSLLVFLACTLSANAQHSIELSGGYLHVTSNQGLDGYTLGGSWLFNPKVALAFNYDSGRDTSTLGAFALTNVGLTVSKTHLQNWLIGPRIYFPGLFKGKGNVKGHIIHPFAEVQFGESNLFAQLQELNVGTQRSADTAFSWTLGAGGDFRLSSHWAARISADLLRTHFVDNGQSSLRLAMGVVYNFKGIR